MLSVDDIEYEPVRKVFEQYPSPIQSKLLYLRQLIIQTVEESNDIEDFTETLKWGEPSYLCKRGSAVRLGWKASLSNQKSSVYQYMLYFHCKTKLVDTFKELYGDLFQYEGNRAIIFNIKNKELPEKAISHCILLSLNYKKIKHLPLLGAKPQG